MHKRHGQLGERLVKLGLITPDDIESALEHQRTAGGYFGDALVELGLLTPDQVRWALADQYDIPFVQIHPENIDRATAMMVPAEWAREHEILPVLRHGDTVTVVLSDPARVDRLDEVRRFTRAARVEAALSSAATLQDLIDSVHGSGNGPPLACSRWLALALESGATALGVSVRGEHVRAWARSADTSYRNLDRSWLDELARAISPFPPSTLGQPRSWPAVLSLNGTAWRVECGTLGGGRSFEWNARILGTLSPDFPRIPVEDAARDAVARHGKSNGITLRADAWDDTPLDFDVYLAALPLGLLGGECRSVHVSDRPSAVPPDVLFVLADGAVEETLAEMEAYSLDALSLDLESITSSELDAARRVAPLVVLHVRSAAAGTVSTDVSVALWGQPDKPSWILQNSADGTN